MSVTICNQFYPDSCFSFMLFVDVENATDVRKAVMAGEFEATLLSPAMILDPVHVQIAANKAVHQQKLNKMTTKNVHSEILFCLSPTKNISQSFKKFGIGDKDKAVFVVIVDDKDGKVQNDIRDRIKGTEVGLEKTQQLADVSAIKEAYKVTDTELTACSLQDAIVSKIASKEFVTV